VHRKASAPGILAAYGGTMSHQALLSCQGLGHRFGRRWVLHDVSFRLEPGEAVVVSGENGSGKSTFLAILCGLVRPSVGTVQRVSRPGFCPQDALLYPYLTPIEHFQLFGVAAGMTPEAIRRNGTALLEALRFSTDAGRAMHLLSGGTRQKLNLALALLPDPPVLLLDEPYAGFDLETYHVFLECLESARQAGRGIVVVSHLGYDRERYDRRLEMRAGTLADA
jgi:ABC-2 type transport system ATP-binding protein